MLLRKLAIVMAAAPAALALTLMAVLSAPNDWWLLSSWVAADPLAWEGLEIVTVYLAMVASPLSVLCYFAVSRGLEKQVKVVLSCVIGSYLTVYGLGLTGIVYLLPFAGFIFPGLLFVDSFAFMILLASYAGHRV